MTRIFRNSVLSLIMAAGISVPVTSAWAQSADLDDWSQTTESYPAGLVYTDDGATVARYRVSELDSANAGGLSALPTTNSEARIETALSVIEMGMSEFEMTTLSGMPAAIGTATMSDGEMAFAATLTGRAGSDRELFSVLYAPKDVFDAMGGLAFLKDNPPSATANYGPGSASTKPSVTVQRLPRKAPASKPVISKPAATKPAGGGYDAQSLLSGVKRDLKVIEEKGAAERAAANAVKDAKRAEASAAERRRLYVASGARQGRYPAPSPKEEFLAWPEKNGWLVQVPRDANSPRIATRMYGGANANPRGALKAFVKDTGLDIKGRTKFEPLEAYKSLDGRDVQILLTETRRGRENGVAFVFYARGKASSKGTIRVIEMSAETYQRWGGAAAMLHMRGVTPNVSVFPSKERRRIASASLASQTRFYEGVLNKFYQENSLALMMTQAQTTAMMTELNYDLLFGNDITPGLWGD